MRQRPLMLRDNLYLMGFEKEATEVGEHWEDLIVTFFERPDRLGAAARPFALMTVHSAGDVAATLYLPGIALIADADLSGKLANAQL
jgi:hypothetical protein